MEEKRAVKHCIATAEWSIALLHAIFPTAAPPQFFAYHPALSHRNFTLKKRERHRRGLEVRRFVAAFSFCSSSGRPTKSGDESSHSKK
jgi:hypothetical protein